MNCYLGIDIGSISTKGVIIDDKNNVIDVKDENGIIVKVEVSDDTEE